LCIDVDINQFVCLKVLGKVYHIDVLIFISLTLCILCCHIYAIFSCISCLLLRSPNTKMSIHKINKQATIICHIHSILLSESLLTFHSIHLWSVFFIPQFNHFSQLFCRSNWCHWSFHSLQMKQNCSQRVYSRERDFWHS
jgi:hypothetical protein